MNRRAYLVENLRSYATLRELRSSSFYARCAAEIDALLHRPEVRPHPAATLRIESFCRIAAWNIEKGRSACRIVELFRADPVLRSADIVVLNEVDKGMARSGNLDVGCRIADQLGMHLVFAAAHLELTKGTDED